MNLLYYCNFVTPFGNMLFSMLTADWLHVVRHTVLLYIISKFQQVKYNSVLEVFSSN
jgi:hypothetical protein